MKKITVLLCDDHTIVRQGLRGLLESSDDIQVVGEAENGLRALGEAKRLQPDVVLMDVAMPLLNGVEATRQISREVPAAKVLMLSSYSDNHFVRQAISAGAAGYLMKETASELLILAIRAAWNGEPSFSPLIAQRLLQQPPNPPHASKSTATPILSGRQSEVLQLIAEGYSTREIAVMLALSMKTVDKHRQALMDKLDIHEIASLTRYAIANGVLESTKPPNWLVEREGSAADEPETASVMR